MVVFEFEQAFALFVALVVVVFEEHALVLDLVMQLLFEPPQLLFFVFDDFIFSPFCSTIIICNFRQNMYNLKKICKKM